MPIFLSLEVSELDELGLVRKALLSFDVGFFLEVQTF